MQMMAVVVPHAAGAAQGRRVGPAQAHAVHALRHGRARGRSRRVGAAIAFQNQGVVIAPGPAVRVRRDRHAGRRHDVPDVARRADHRARPRQRHLDDHPGGHRRGPAGGDRRHAGARAHRRNQPGAGADPVRAWWSRSRRSSCSSSARSGASRSTTRSASRAAACIAGQTTHLPFKLNMSGVIPPIFASSLLLFPATIASWFGTTSNFGWLQNVRGEPGAGQPVHMILYGGADHLLLLLLHRAGVQLARDGGEPEEVGRVHSRHPPGPADGRVHRQGADAPDGLGRAVRHGWCACCPSS